MGRALRPDPLLPAGPQGIRQRGDCLVITLLSLRGRESYAYHDISDSKYFFLSLYCIRLLACVTSWLCTYGTVLSLGGSILPATRWTASTSTLQHLRVFHMTSSTLSPCAHIPPLLPSLSPLSLSLLPLISGYIPSHGEDHRVLRQRQADIPRRAHGLKGRLGPGSGLYQSIAALSRFQSIVGHRSI